MPKLRQLAANSPPLLQTPQPEDHQRTTRGPPEDHMTQLAGLAQRVSAILKERGETVAVSETSAGGLISAALLAIPGASDRCENQLWIQAR